MKKRTLILCGLLLSISLLAGCQTQEAATADKTQEASDISAEDTQEEDGQASDTDTTDDETEIAEPEDDASSAAQENVSGKVASFEIPFEKETVLDTNWPLRGGRSPPPPEGGTLRPPS